MRKKFILLLILLLAIVSMASYLLLTDKITAGKQKIADGEKQLAAGQKMLAEGKAKLSSGQQRLSNSKNLYNGIQSVPFMGIVIKLPVSGDIFQIAKSKINEGSSLVAKGNEKIKSGEDQLAEGKLELQHGEQRLIIVNDIRIACGIGAAFFSLLFIVLGFLWKSSFKTTRNFHH